MTVLAGKRRVDGIEFEARGSITPNWDIYSGIALMDGRSSGPANVRERHRSESPTWRATSGPCTASAHGWEVGGGVRGQNGLVAHRRQYSARQIPSYLSLMRPSRMCKRSTRCG